MKYGTERITKSRAWVYASVDDGPYTRVGQVERVSPSQWTAYRMDGDMLGDFTTLCEAARELYGEIRND